MRIRAMARATETAIPIDRARPMAFLRDGAAGDSLHLDTQHVYRRLGLYDEPAQEGPHEE